MEFVVIAPWVTVLWRRLSVIGSEQFRELAAVSSNAESVMSWSLLGQWHGVITGSCIHKPMIKKKVGKVLFKWHEGRLFCKVSRLFRSVITERSPSNCFSEAALRNTLCEIIARFGDRGCKRRQWSRRRCGSSSHRAVERRQTTAAWPCVIYTHHINDIMRSNV